MNLHGTYFCIFKMKFSFVFNGGAWIFETLEGSLKVSSILKNCTIEVVRILNVSERISKGILILKLETDCKQIKNFNPLWDALFRIFFQYFS